LLRAKLRVTAFEESFANAKLELMLTTLVLLQAKLRVIAFEESFANAKLEHMLTTLVLLQAKLVGGENQ